MAYFLFIMCSATAGILLSANLTVSLMIVAALISVSLTMGVLIYADMLIIFSALLGFELLAWSSSYPENKLFNKTWVHFLVLLSRLVWVMFAGFMLYRLITTPLPSEVDIGYYRNALIIISMWLLLANIPMAGFRLFTCFKTFRTRLIKYNDEFKTRLESKSNTEKQN